MDSDHTTGAAIPTADETSELGPLIPASNTAAAAWALFTGIGLMMIGNGLQGTLVGIRSEQAGFGTNTIGIVMSGYFVGILVGSRAATKALRSVGHIRVFAALASLASTATLVYLLTVNPVAWGLMRFAMGFCMAGLYVVAESWINDLATNANRGRMLAFYMVVSMGGFAVGQLLLNIPDRTGVQLFLISSVLISLALVPTSLSASSSPPTLTPDIMSIRDLAAIVPTGIVVSVLVGMANGALIGMGAVYATRAGLGPGEVSLFMGAPMIGGVIGQFPVGLLADRFPRRPIMIALGFIAAVAATALLIVDSGSVPGYLLMFIIGTCTFPLYSLSIAYTNDWIQPEQILGASAALVTTNAVGATVGPFLATVLMNTFGPPQYFVSLIITHAAVGLYVVYRVLTKPGSMIPRPKDFRPYPARASAVAVFLLPRRTRRNGA
ncbi:MAG: MFS transporter [Acidimicrobiia bacterium]|nr:MFS transporter [Acidimicrobiia bacterium]